MLSPLCACLTWLRPVWGRVETEPRPQHELGLGGGDGVGPQQALQQQPGRLAPPAPPQLRQAVSQVAADGGGHRGLAATSVVLCILFIQSYQRNFAKVFTMFGKCPF